ncbi:MAG: hypothetical protein IKP84_01655 [Prevotella sp.]|nr:hypothetical protein [Prevotella sp.]
MAAADAKPSLLLEGEIEQIAFAICHGGWSASVRMKGAGTDRRRVCLQA